MGQKLFRTLGFIIIATILSSCQGPQIQKGKAQGDTISIVDVAPKEVSSGVKTDFAVEVVYSLQSADAGRVYIGFNTEEANRFQMMGYKQVGKGNGRVKFKYSVVPKNWGEDGKFYVYVNLSKYPHPEKWNPLISDQRKIHVTGIEAKSQAYQTPTFLIKNEKGVVQKFQTPDGQIQVNIEYLRPDSDKKYRIQRYNITWLSKTEDYRILKVKHRYGTSTKWVMCDPRKDPYYGSGTFAKGHPLVLKEFPVGIPLKSPSNTMTAVYTLEKQKGETREVTIRFWVD